MTVFEQEQCLFIDWKKQRNYVSFTYDGIFDYDTYFKQKIRILYVLKEADWQDYQGDFQLKDYLLSEVSPTYWKTWNNIARWTKGILEGGDYPKKVTRADKTYWLKRIAFIELKKEAGGSSSNTDEIAEYAQNDSDYILKQIKLYQPDLIICCGRGNGKNADLLYNHIFPKESLTEWKTPLTKENYNYFTVNLCDKNVPVISFVHPQMRGGHINFQRKYTAIIEIKNALFPDL